MKPSKKNPYGLVVLAVVLLCTLAIVQILPNGPYSEEPTLQQAHMPLVNDAPEAYDPESRQNAPQQEQQRPESSDASNGTRAADLEDVPASEQAPPAHPSPSFEQAFSPAANEEVAVAGGDDDLPEHEGGAVLVTLPEGSTRNDLNAAIEGLGFVSAQGISDTDIEHGLVKLTITNDTPVSEAVIRLGYVWGIEAAQPNFILHAAEEAEEVASLEGTALEAAAIGEYDRALDHWQLDSLRLPEAWGIARCKGSVAIAVIDTGADLDHPDLESNISFSWNTHKDSSDAQDVNGHGTHVAGIAAAAAYNGQGVAGTSYNARLIILKASYDPGEATADGTATKDTDFDSQAIIRAYQWIAEHASEYNIKVVNLSVAGPYSGTSPIGTNYALIREIQRAYDAGILTVCAAGNITSGTEPYVVYPGEYSNVLTVINMASSGTQADSSNYNISDEHVKNVSAPGSGIYSTIPDNSYGPKSGTSMATPMVSGVAALLYAANPTITPAEAIATLETTARDLGQTGWDRLTGYGEVDAYSAVISAVAASLTADANVIAVNGMTELSIATGASELESSSWTYKSSNPDIASVDADGHVIGKSTGTTTITATSSASPDISLATTIEVINPNITGPANIVAPTNGSLPYGYAVSGASTYTFAFSTSDQNIASFSGGTLYGKRAGTVTVKATCTSNPNIVATMEVQVSAPTSIDGALVTLSQTAYTYDGSAKAPQVNVRMGSTTLVPDTDYAVSYSSNVRPGTASATITGKGLYTGTLTRSFTIDVSRVDMYRLYNPNSGEHFYTSNKYERSFLVEVGWRFEGIGWVAPSWSSTPVYRLYNPNGGDHHYTTAIIERDVLISVGWTYEGIGWYSDDARSVPLYRQYNPNASTGSHNFTTSKGENDWLISLGWHGEGIAWYGVR